MIAFHGKVEIKDKYVKRMRKHIELDQLIRGKYTNDENPASPEFRGCAVGCVLHSSNHEDYEAELGIPTQLALLHDACFEGVPSEQAAKFALDFLEIIPIGADLSGVINHFYVWLLIDPENGVIRFADNDNERTVITNVAVLHQRVIDGDIPLESEWDAAWDATWDATRDAAWDAAWDATRAAARDATRDATRDAAWAAARAAARDAAWAAAWAAAFEKIAARLLELLATAPVPELVTE